MPLRKEFFIDPLFRLTQPFSLNDPFDSKPTKEAIRKKTAFMSDSVGEGAGFISDQEIESKHFNVKKYLEEELHKFGIISLTENPHNLLMWSHYADEHNGVVISISNTDETFSFSEHGIDRSRIGNKSAIRVLYDSKRPVLIFLMNVFIVFTKMNFSNISHLLKVTTGFTKKSIDF